MRLTVSCILYCLALTGLIHAQDLNSGSFSYQLLYTGRLMGYARVPDAQVLNSGVPANLIPNAVAQQYMDEFGRARVDHRLEVRLAMGDNFAPDLLGRTFEIPGAADKRGVVREAKDRFFYQNGRWVRWQTPETRAEIAGQTSIDFDNVAQFFVSVKYNAMVPGKHDFYYGAERLRDLAGFLERHQVHMLGANLILQTRRQPGATNAYPRIPERYAFHPAYSTDFGGTSVDLPDPVLPWKQFFVFRNARQVKHLAASKLATPREIAGLAASGVQYQWLIDSNRVNVCFESGEETHGDPAHVPVPGQTGSQCQRLVSTEDICTAANMARWPAGHRTASLCRSLYEGGVYSASDAGASPDVTYVFNDPAVSLKAGFNHQVCAMVYTNPNVPGPARLSCHPFSVQMPLFTWGRNPAPSPYAVVGQGSTRVAVFGVVDPDLLGNVGTLNTNWINVADVQDETASKAVAADSSLRQALEYCSGDEACRTARKVLMAQMPYAKAGQLMVHFSSTFDAVLSEAEKEHETEDVTESKRAEDAGFVLTPAVPYTIRTGQGQPAFAAKVYRAVISREPDKASAGKPTWKLSNQPFAGTPVSLNAPARAPGTATLQLFAVIPPPKGTPLQANHPRVLAPDRYEMVRDFALEAMRGSLKADMAVLQKRDLFDAASLSEEVIPVEELQNQINRIFWKNDFVIKLQVSGATIKKIMAQAAKFDQLDQDALSTDVEKGRGLMTLGLYKDPSDPNNYYVNGSKMDDSKLYTVAASQFMGLGDTGYADLATPDVPPAQRLADLKGLISIGDLVCQQIAQTLSPKPYCATDNFDSDYFDQTSQRALDNTVGFSTQAHYRAFFPINFSSWKTLRPRQFTPVHVDKAAEKAVQNRTYTSLNIENLDFSLSGVFINNVTRTSANFAGVSVPGVTSSGSRSLGADHKVRLIRDYKFGGFYLLSDSSFLQNTTTSSPVATLANNMWGAEGGGTLGRLRLRPFQLSAQYSFRFEGELTDPARTQISFSLPAAQLPSTATAPPVLYLNTPKASTMYGRAGMRAQYADTYFELGLEEINSMNVLRQYVFQNAGGGALYCQPGAAALSCGTDPTLNSSLNSTPISGVQALALANVRPSSVVTGSFKNSGAYFNFNIKFPLWSKQDSSGVDQSWYLILANRGDLFFNSHYDTSVQTRYLDKFTAALTIPIYGRLALMPKADFVLYENKINQYHYRALQPSISLSYTFNWREGMYWWRGAARYGAIVTAPNAAGSTQ